MAGFLPNLLPRNFSIESTVRPYIQVSKPSANMFLQRSASFLPMSTDSTAPMVSVPMATSCTWNASKAGEPRGLDSYPTLVRLRLVNSSELTMRMPPEGRSSMLALSAAGFIATSTSGRSPAVRMS